MIRSILILASAAACTTAAVAQSPKAGTEVVVTIRGVSKAQGDLYVNLCRKAEFLTPKCYKSAARKVTKTGEYVVPFANVEPGSYAVLALHDVNGNRALDRSGYGAPTEPSGVSGSFVTGQMPQFDRSAFVVGASPTRLSLELR